MHIWNRTNEPEHTLGILEEMLVKAQARMTEWAAGLATDPVKTFKWYERGMAAAADVQVLTQLIEIGKSETKTPLLVKALRDHVREVSREALRSTDPVAGTMLRQVALVWDETMRWNESALREWGAWLEAQHDAAAAEASEHALEA